MTFKDSSLKQNRKHAIHFTLNTIRVNRVTVNTRKNNKDKGHFMNQ